LAKNIEDLKNAKAKVDSASSGRKGPGLAKPGHKRVTLDCTLLATKMAEISKAESGSDDLSTKASELATATIECTDKTVLTSISKELEEKSDEAQEALDSVNALLTTLGEDPVTSSGTPSPSPPSPSTSTAATGKRKRNYKMFA